MTSQSTSRIQSSATSRSRVLGLTWLAAGALVAVPALMLLLLSDPQDGRPVGLVMLGLVVSAVALGSSLLSSQAASLRWVSLGLSAVWLVAAVLLYPTQTFAADAVWVAGAVALGGVATGFAAWRAR